jgi:hypothetical protein
VLTDIERCRAIGAHEVIVEPQLTAPARSIDAYAAFMEQVADGAARRELVASGATI